MEYRSIISKLRHMNEFVKECGLFTCETELNGGFGCRSKSKDKDEPGCCFSFDCPLAYEATLADMKRLDYSLYEQYKDTVDSDGDIESGWVVQYREVVK